MINWVDKEIETDSKDVKIVSSATIYKNISVQFTIKWYARHPSITNQDYIGEIYFYDNAHSGNTIASSDLEWIKKELLFLYLRELSKRFENLNQLIADAHKSLRYLDRIR